MTRRSEREWLSDIIAWGERLQSHLAGVSREHFFANPLVQDAVSKCVEAIGEAAGKLDDANPELDKTVSDLSLKLARRTRDRLSHGYYGIDLAILWETAIVAVPKTVAAARLVKTQYDGEDGETSGSPP